MTDQSHHGFAVYSRQSGEMSDRPDYRKLSDVARGEG